jgi:hypothetical protein
VDGTARVKHSAAAVAAPERFKESGSLELLLDVKLAVVFFHAVLVHF